MSSVPSPESCPNQSCGRGFPVPSSGGKEGESENHRKRALRKSLSQHWPAIRQGLEKLAQGLPKARLARAITILSEGRKRRFLRSRRPKYGSMNKGFTEEELERFFRCLEEPKMRLLFSYQATLGLRIGEAVRIHIRDLNLRTKELRIFTEKSGKTDFLLVPDRLFETTMEYIAREEQAIAQARGFLFHSLRPGNRKPETAPHIKPTTAREYLRSACRKARLDETYGYRYGQRANPLHRLTTHSLRHFAITTFCRRNNGNVMLASRFARHTNLQTTQTYLHVGREELYQSIQNTCGQKAFIKAKSLQDSLL